MTSPVSLRRAAALIGAICLGAGFATASFAYDGGVTVAQNGAPPVPPAQGEEENKEHKKDHGEKGQQKGPQGEPPAPNASPGNAGNPQPEPGPQGGEPRGRHRAQQPVEQPQQEPVQQPPVENRAPKILPPTPPPTTPQVAPQQEAAPQEQQQPERVERKRRPREETSIPPAAPNAQPQVVAPPAAQPAPFSAVPGMQPAPGTPQQEAAPQEQQHPERVERKRRPREETATPPAAPNAQPQVVAPPAAQPAPFSAVPGMQPAPGTPQLPPGLGQSTPAPQGPTPTPAPQLPPGLGQSTPAPQGPAPTPPPQVPPGLGQSTPAPQDAAPNNAQIPDTGFKRRSRTEQGERKFERAPEHATLPQAPPPQGAQPSFSPKFTPGFAPAGQSAQRLQDLQKRRTQRTEEGGRRTVIEEPDNRVIVRQDNRVFVRHDETVRLATRARNVHSQRRPDGSTETVIVRPGGVLIYNVVDGSGRLIRRYRRDDRGREINIIDNRRFYQGAAAGLAIAAGIGLAAGVLDLHLGPPRIGIPRGKYIVDYDSASDDDLYEALIAPPIERLDRAYSLEEIRYNHELRDRMRRIDLNTINFDFGAWDVAPDQYRVLARIARAINRAVDRNPGEVFLIEGHTDAVGSDIDNLSLSDRRAQSVAEILTYDFDVPPENLVTQGYGEEYLKIPTPAPERLNRRVAVRRITPLMAYDYR